MTSVLPPALRKRLKATGFDLIEPFCVSWYNGVVQKEYQVEDFGRQRSLGVVIGANKNLWGAFLRSMKEDPSLQALDHPLDVYTERCISEDLVREALVDSGLSSAGTSHHPAVEIFYSHHWGPTQRKIAIQRMAHVASLAFLNEACHLNVHPTFGSYISLKACSERDSFPP